MAKSDKTSDNLASRSPKETGELTGGARILHSDELLQDGDEVFIRHGEDLYRLRKTRQGKLILCK